MSSRLNFTKVSFAQTNQSKEHHHFDLKALRIIFFSESSWIQKHQKNGYQLTVSLYKSGIFNTQTMETKKEYFFEIKQHWQTVFIRSGHTSPFLSPESYWYLKWSSDSLIGNYKNMKNNSWILKTLSYSSVWFRQKTSKCKNISLFLPTLWYCGQLLRGVTRLNKSK